MFGKAHFFREVMVKQFDEIVERLPNKTAIIYHNERTRFVDLKNFSHKVANWLESENINLGLDDGKLPQIDDGTESIKQPQIGLMLGNTPELAGFLVGISRVRAASVLFNINHRQDSLLNSFEVTNCRVVVFEAKYLEAIREIASQLSDDIKFYMYDRTGKVELNNNKVQFDKENYGQYNGMSKVELNGPNVDNFAHILNLYPDTVSDKKYSYELADNVSLE